MTLVKWARVITLTGSGQRRIRLRQTWGIREPVLRWFIVTPDIENPARGCLQAHLAVLSTAREPTLILEDDAVFAPAFTLDLHPPVDWDVLWLGGEHIIRPMDIPAYPEWVKPLKMLRTHAYIARQPWRLARMIEDSGVRLLDPHLASLPLHQYALRTFTVGQDAGLSDISGTSRPSASYWNFAF
jgi:hypothetical protein